LLITVAIVLLTKYEMPVVKHSNMLLNRNSVDVVVAFQDRWHC
jgi:hypothetical protein